MKLWGGRFEKGTDAAMDAFHSSIMFDSRMAEQDVMGSIAHTQMLARQEIIAQVDADQIIDGLNDILHDIKNGTITFRIDAEDIHMNIESLLTERIGEAGKRVHTGRSRNDQVALDMRLYMREAVASIRDKLVALEKVLCETAEKNINTIMPGYTHLQKAQPITLAHHIMAYFEMFRRDIERLDDWMKRMNVSPLGSGALATSTYEIDRFYIAEALGFSGVCKNSLDAVSDRDFCIEFSSCASLIMMHLSRFCEELILWSSDEFRFVEMDDAYSTGSSIMPQKKNPDVAELIRGKTGRVYGDLIGLLTMIKALPLAYNKDMQEDKEMTFDAIDTVSACLELFMHMFATLRFKQDQMRKGAAQGFTNATDAADYLVKKGLPFRSAHEVIGKLVLSCIEQEKAIEDLSLEELQKFSDLFGEDVFQAVSLDACVNDRNVFGGPSPEAMQVHLDDAAAFLKQS